MSEIIISTEFLTELDLSPKKESRVVAVILKPKRTENFFNADIMGTTSLELVRTAAKNYTTFVKKYYIKFKKLNILILNIVLQKFCFFSKLLLLFYDAY